MKYLHTMVRVTNLDESLDFYCNKLGLKEIRRMENEKVASANHTEPVGDTGAHATLIRAVRRCR